DTAFFRTDPNTPVCHTLGDGYKRCVGGKSEECHETLRLMKRTVQDEVDDWYNTTCRPPLVYSAIEAADCYLGCQSNCTALCNQSVVVGIGLELGRGITLANCTNNCSSFCEARCLSDEVAGSYADVCLPPPPYNCTSNCLAGYGDEPAYRACVPPVRFCSVYDERGQLRRVDPNCSSSLNVSHETRWGNVSVFELLDDPGSELSAYVGVNASRHTCFNDCTNESVGLFFHGAAADEAGALAAANCTTVCYETACLSACFQNCTDEEEYAALPPCEPGPDCVSATNCSFAERYRNCSAEKAHAVPPPNITEITLNETIWVPPWDPDVCAMIVAESTT
ncbi:MAG: hypothetical protein VX747_01005, partial [Actinomycetota bacterium]|nr:hypothetical protein [Actinomycetota bacterium]